jgi:hypothetical protein
VLSFWSWRDNLEDTYDSGIAEISIDDGAHWTKLIPTYPGTFETDSASCAATEDAPARAGFTGNDASWQGPYTADLGAYAGARSRIRFDFGTDPAVTSVGWYVDDIEVTNVAQAGACTAVPATVPEVSSVASGIPLLIARNGSSLVLSYQEIPGAGGYNIYEGTLLSWYSHAGSPTNVCGAATTSAGGRRATVVTPGAGDRYYHVTAYASVEGPSGFATEEEIPPAESACAP